MGAGGRETGLCSRLQKGNKERFIPGCSLETATSYRRHRQAAGPEQGTEDRALMFGGNRRENRNHHRISCRTRFIAAFPD